MVVPPGRSSPRALRRVLVPLEGTISTSLAPRSTIELAAGEHVDVIALDVDEDGEDGAWTREFLAGYCPWGIGEVRLERRAGKPGRDRSAPLPRSRQSDVVVFGWARQLSEGRAPVVRAALERSTIPVMLIPVSVEGGDDERP